MIIQQKNVIKLAQTNKNRTCTVYIKHHAAILHRSHTQKYNIIFNSIICKPLLILCTTKKNKKYAMISSEFTTMIEQQMDC